MKALILCAGYATRLYPLTKDKPKQLLPIAGKPMLEHTIAKLDKVPEIDAIYIVTNHKFAPQFQEWIRTLNTNKEIKLFDDGSTDDKTKLGAIGDIKFVIEKAHIDDDLLIAAGDNLFKLDLNNFVRFFKAKGMSIAIYDVKDKRLVKEYSEVKLDTSERVVSFKEKPQNPQTTLSAICIYLFPRQELNIIGKYLDEGNNPDQPGRYIQWLYQREHVYGFVFPEKWYDIGDLAQYKQADKEYSESK